MAVATGYTTTVSSIAGGSAANLTDGNVGTYWYTGSAAPQWVQAQFLSPIILIGYTLRAATSYNGYAPTAWSFQGSADGSSWTTLDTKAGQSWAPVEAKVFAFINEVSYLYYRVYVTTTGGSGLTLLGEWALELSNVANASADLTSETFLYVPSIMGQGDMAAEAVLTTDALIGADCHLVAATTLTADAATIWSASADLVAASALVAAARVVAPNPQILGAVTLAVGPTASVGALVAPRLGTLANPIAALDTDTKTFSFAGAQYVATDPVPHTGPLLAPSMWYVFTEAVPADLTAGTASGFPHGATIAIYQGPANALPENLTFIATNGEASTDLGVVSIAAGPSLGAAGIMSTDLGEITMAAGPSLAGDLLAVMGSATLTAAAILTADATISRAAAKTFIAAARLITVAVVARAGEAILVADSTLTTDGTVTTLPDAILTADSTLTADGTVTP